MKDKTTIGSALHFYNNRLYVGCVYDDGSYGDIDVTEAVAKALRPQSHWKPSEEQMKALLSQLPVIKGSGDAIQKILESLYNDLKKL